MKTANFHAVLEPLGKVFVELEDHNGYRSWVQVYHALENLYAEFMPGLFVALLQDDKTSKSELKWLRFNDTLAFSFDPNNKQAVLLN